MKHLAIAILLICHIPYTGVAWGHHSIEADFAAGEYITIRALAKEFRFINPHPYVTAAELDAKGEEKEWTLMLDDRWELVEAGFSRSTFQPGDELIVTGMPSRRETNTLYVQTIERPSDGFVYQEDDGEDYDD